MCQINRRHASASGMKECLDKFNKFKMPEHEDIQNFAQAIGLRIAVHGMTGGPLTCMGDPTLPLLELSNVASRDGSGKHVSHFRLIWRKNAPSCDSSAFLKQAWSYQKKLFSDRCHDLGVVGVTVFNVNG